MAGTALNMDTINELLSTSKSRGDYEVELRNFIAGPDAGIEVDLTTGTLTGKDPKNVATGFNNARKKMNEDTGLPAVAGGNLVKVLLRWVDTGQPALDENGAQIKNDKGVPQNVKEGHVFLINTAKIAGAAAPASDEVAVEGEDQ